MIITLIGMAGGGKSTVGRALARKLGYGFVDTDHLIEEATGKSLQALIDESGDMALIGVEEKCILSLQMQDDHVISTGGSVVYSERSMEFLKSSSTIVFLDVPFPTLQRRLANLDSRGVVGLKGGSLYDIYQERILLYEGYADIIVKVSGRDAVRKVVAKVMDALSLD